MAIQPKWWKVFRSNISGQKPTVNNLDLDAIGINRVDGVLFIKKRSLGGVEEIVEIVGGPTGTGNLHNRAHQIDSIDDHPPVPINKRDKWVHTNADTGAVELVEQSPQGDPGITPHIGANGNWWIGTTDTGVKAQGEDGNDGINPHVGANGHWWVGTFDTGIKAAGTDGEDGLTPYIGTNGNWWVGETDTGVKAQGEDGNPADLIHNTYFAWRDAPNVGFTLVDNLHSAYEAMLVTHEVLNPPVESDFNGLWRARLTESSADKYYRHEQNIPSAVWSINHRLLKYPSVSILDTGGNTVEANINHIDNQNLILTFSAPFSGFADLN